MQASHQLVDSDLGDSANGKDSAYITDINHIAIWNTDDISAGILAIIFDYALDKFDNSRERLASGMINFLSVINGFVMTDKPVDMCLPGFPFKSANKVNKVLGFLPDKAEELALQRLDTMCLRIRDIYSPGARITIISDGIVYNGQVTSHDIPTSLTYSSCQTCYVFQIAIRGPTARLYGL